MKQKLKGILALLCLLSGALIIIVVNWKQILVTLGISVIGVLVFLVFVMIIGLVGMSSGENRWDKE